MSSINARVGRPKLIDRSAIVDIALKKYWSQGINNVTIAEIAKEAGASRPGVYKEFKSAANLKVLSLRKYEQIVAKHYYHAFNNTKNLPKFLDRIVIDQLDGVNQAHPYCYLYTTISLRFSLEKEPERELNRIFKKLEKSIRVAVEKAKKLKLINNILDTQDTARAINSHLMNIIVMHRAGIAKNEIKNISKLFIHSLTSKVN